MLEKNNYKTNTSVVIDDGIINGQSCSPAGKMKYGLFNLSHGGSEMIAIYNAVQLLGQKAPLSDICLEMYRDSSVLCGLLGSNPLKLDTYFRNHNIPCYKMNNSESFWAELTRSKCGIISFWKMHGRFKLPHTVCVEIINGRIRVYNLNSKHAYSYEYCTHREFTNPKDFIVGYCFKKLKTK